MFEDDAYDSEDDEVYVIPNRPKAAGPAPVKPENLAKRDLKTGSKLAFGSGSAAVTLKTQEDVTVRINHEAAQ